MQSKNRSKQWQSAVLTLLVGVPFILPGNGLATDNLSFRGVLLQEACTLRAGDEAIALDLRDVSTKYLYLNTRTLGKPFEIHLEGCDTSIGSTVTTTFSGAASVALPGLLAVNSGSAARGVAIGIETPAGKLLALNMASDQQVLSSGNNVISLRAFIKGEPQSIASQSIAAGDFTVMSTFTLDYP